MPGTFYFNLESCLLPCPTKSSFTQGFVLILFLSVFSSFQNRELQIMRKLDHCNIVRLRYFFYSSGEKVCVLQHNLLVSELCLSTP